MRPARMIRQLVIAGALLCAVSVVRAGAQESPAPVTPVPSVDGTRLRPEWRHFQLTVTRNGVGTLVGERIVEIREVMHGGRPAWAIVERRSAGTTPSGDSVVVTRDGLVALHWEGTAGGARLAAAFAGDTMYAALGAGAQRSTLVAATVAHAILSAGMLEVVLPHLPLATGWSAPLSLLVVTPGAARVVSAELVVEREERIDVPGGGFNCWVVTVRTERSAKQLWVSRDGRGVVRSIERLPDVGTVILEQSLLAMQRH